MLKLTTFLKGAGLGAALMYLFDPDRGRRRRALLLDQCDHARHSMQDFVSKAERDARNRMSGLRHEAGAMLRSSEADDCVLVERVRSKLGRYVSHPHAVNVEARDGEVILKGPVLAGEVDDLIKAVRRVRGVKSIESLLDVHNEAGNVSALQGGRTPPGEPFDFTQNNWSPATRAFAQGTGLALVANCLARRGLFPMILGTAGFALFVRGLTNRNLGQLTGLQVCPPAARFQRTVTIAAPVERVWDFITDFEQVARFLPSAKSVENLGDGRYRWAVSLPGGADLELEERITQSVLHERLAWESISNRPVSYSGSVKLEPEGEGATRVNVHFDYTPVGGFLGERLASLFGLDPESKFHDAVNRVKTFLEEGQVPHDVEQRVS